MLYLHRQGQSVCIVVRFKCAAYALRQCPAWQQSNHPPTLFLM
jgi:ATP-dependent Clp protease adapter protein ClpS